ncbi:MAG: hypothetical protein R6W84_10060, partial [Promethearchaeia archaeon]
YAEDLIFSKNVKVKKKFSNRELKLYNYFSYKTGGFFPDNIIVMNDFIFYFINPKYYFLLSEYIHGIRKDFNKNKVLFIRNEEKLIKLLFSFFPDTYIHDVHIKWMESKKNERKSLEGILISISFLSYEDRGIAIGRKGSYINTVNQLFRDYIYVQNEEFPIRIECELEYL